MEIRFTFATDGSQRVETSFAWNFIGKSCSACQKVIDVVDRIRKSDLLRMYDLEEGKLAFEIYASSGGLEDDPFPPTLRRIVSIAAKAEERFGVTLAFTDQITEQDAESFLYLDCLLNGRSYGKNLSVPMALVKQEIKIASPQALLFSGQPMSLYLEPNNYPGFFPLFGNQVPTPAWGLYTEQCVVEDAESARSRYERTQLGEKINLTMIAKTDTFVRWKEKYRHCST